MPKGARHDHPHRSQASLVSRARATRRVRGSVRALRIGLAALFGGAAVLHTRNRPLFESLVPASLRRYSEEVNLVSEATLVAIGTGVLVRPLRRPGRWVATALLLGSLPEALNQVREPDRMKALGLPQPAVIARVPVQLGVLALIWIATQKR